jgi:isoleucyl-tRNA synthetase
VVQPNFKRLGPRVGKLMPKLKTALLSADGAALMEQLEQTGKISLEVSGQKTELDGEDVQIRLRAKQGWAAAQGPNCVVVLATDLTPELIREGYARDIVRFIGERRKELKCDYTDRIIVAVVTDNDQLQAAVLEHAQYIQSETLAVELALEPLEDADSVEHQLAGGSVRIFVKPAPAAG